MIFVTEHDAESNLKFYGKFIYKNRIYNIFYIFSDKTLTYNVKMYLKKLAISDLKSWCHF